MHLVSRHGLKVIKALTPILLIGSFGLTLAVMMPGVGVTINGATRWLGAGPLQFQPSELLKLALVLYAAQSLAMRPRATKTFKGLVEPAADRRRGGLPAAAQAARHGDGAGDLPGDRHAADRGGHTDAAARHDLRDAASARRSSSPCSSPTGARG